MKHARAISLVEILLAASVLLGACYSHGASKAGGDATLDAGADAASPDRALADAVSADQDVDHAPTFDLSASRDQHLLDSAPRGDLGVSYGGSFPANPTPGFHDIALTIDGIKRNTTVYIPIGWKKHLPLIIACPATDGNSADGIWDVAANELADQEKMVVVSVEPAKKPVGDWDQHDPGEAYFETYPNETFATNNDLKLVVAAIAEAERVYAIDPKRVFLSGYSNGAFFAQFAAFHLPNRIAGFAASGGGLVQCADTSDCTFNGAAVKTLTCSALAKLPGWCNCSGPDKPGLIPTAGRKPAAYLHHAADDDVVSIYYDCQLHDRLSSLGYPVKFDLPLKGGHNAPPHFMVTAWTWLSSFRLP